MGADLAEVEHALIHEFANLWSRHPQQLTGLTRGDLGMSPSDENLLTPSARVNHPREQLSRLTRERHSHLVATGVQCTVHSLDVTSEHLSHGASICSNCSIRNNYTRSGSSGEWITVRGHRLGPRSVTTRGPTHVTHAPAPGPAYHPLRRVASLVGIVRR